MRAVWAAVFVLAAAPAMAGEDCAAVDASMAKADATPRRVEVRLMTANNPDTTMTIIIIGRDYYRLTSLEKSWEKASYDPENATAQYLKLAQDRRQTCRADASETLDGAAADVFVVDRDNGFHQRMWIAHESRLPLKYDETYASGMHAITQLIYTDVKAPQ